MAAQTSLARQLELLKTPQTSAQKEKHGSVSFVYSFFEGKSISAQTRYSEAIAGLHGLISIDQRIEKYKESLFSKKSMKFDRAVQTAEMNMEIDEVIEEYLFCVVSKYFQLVDTHKTIEWLIYQYKVNEYNIDALIGSVLPYHETRLFTRLLQTCSGVKNSKNSRWFWLKPVQENGVPLSKGVLLGHCSKNHDFTRFVTDSVLKAMKYDMKNSIYPSFLVSFCLNLCEIRPSEPTIYIIISVLTKTLNMKKCNSLYEASLMIIAHLCSVTKLNSEVVIDIMKSLLNEKSDFEVSLISFEIICKTQNLVVKLPATFLKNKFILKLVDQSGSYNFEYLVKCLFYTIINSCDENIGDEQMNHLNQIVRKLFTVNNGLNEMTIVTLIGAIDEVTTRNQDQPNSEKIKSFLADIVSTVEKQYPKWFITAIETLQSTSNIIELLNSVRFSAIDGFNMPLIIGLSHSNHDIRDKSLKHLAENIDLFMSKQNDIDRPYLKQIIKSTITDNLDAFKPKVLLSIFGIKEKIFEIFQPMEFELVASKLLNICDQNEFSTNYKWNKLKSTLLHTYCSQPFSSYGYEGDKTASTLNNIFASNGEYIKLFNYLLPINDYQMKNLLIILNSEFGKTHPLLIKINSKCQEKLCNAGISSSNTLTKIVTQDVFNCIFEFFLDNLQSLLNESIYSNLLNAIESGDSRSQRQASIILIYILTKIIHKLSESNSPNIEVLGERITKLLSTQLRHLKLGTESSIDISDVSEFESIDMLNWMLTSLDTHKCNVFPSLLVSYICKTLIQTSLQSISEWHYGIYHILLNYSTKNDTNGLPENVFKLFHNLLIMFITKITTSTDFQFFSPIIANSLDQDILIRTLTVLDNLFRETENFNSISTSIENNPQFMVPYLIGLSSNVIEIRQLALSNLKLITSQIKTNFHLKQFIQILLDSEEDILSNIKIASQIMCRLCNSKDTHGGRSIATGLLNHIFSMVTSNNCDSDIPIDLRVSLLKLLIHADLQTKMNLFEYEYNKFFNEANTEEQKFTMDDEMELKTLLLFMRNKQEKIFKIEDGKVNYICKFYLSLINSTPRRIVDLNSRLTFAIYDLLTKHMFEQCRASNEDFSIQVVVALLRIQMTFSETGSTSVGNVNLIDNIRKRIRRLTNDGLFVVRVLDHLLPIETIYETFTCGKEKKEKRSRHASSEGTSKFSTNWKLLRIYVGLFQSQVFFHNSSRLVKTLFDYLKLTFMEVDDDSNEYSRQTILYMIVECFEAELEKMNRTKNGKIVYDDEELEENLKMHVDTDDQSDLLDILNSINVDVVIDCMRESRLRETRKVALLLVNLVAPYFHKQILEYLVAIFTFIGTNLLQCDDQYSLAILFETMESIIPIILTNNDKIISNEIQPETNMKQYIVSIFVKSFSDIPSYRRLPLFTKLVQLLGEEQFLSIISVRLIEESCLRKKATRSEKDVWISLLQGLFTQFSSQTQLTSLCILLCLFERKFFDQHLKKKSMQNCSIIGQVDNLKDSTMDSFKFISGLVCKEFTTKIVFDSEKLSCGVDILKFIVLVISNEEFVRNTNGVLSSLLIYFMNLLLELIVSLSPVGTTIKDSFNTYRKRIKITLDEMLLGFNALLPSERLINIVIDDLLNNTAQLEPSISCLVQRKGLELLNEKLTIMNSTEIEYKLAIKIIETLNDRLPSRLKQINKLDDTQVHNIQLMMVSLKFSTKFLLPKPNDSLLDETKTTLTKALKHINGLAKSIEINSTSDCEQINSRTKTMQNLKSSCILCATQILCTMSLEGIEYLSDVLSIILGNFDSEDDIIIISNISSVSKIIIKFAQFLSPHLNEIILKLLHMNKYCDKVSNLQSKLKINWINISKLVPKRTVFEAIDSIYEDATTISPQSIVELMNLFKMSCDNLEKSDISVIVKSFKLFMLKALSYRSKFHDKVNLDIIEQIESAFGEAFSAFIPKLTETTFRPIFYKLLDWSIQVESLKKFNEQDESYFLPNECYYRMIAFYRFCSLLADRLKSLFCVFVAPTIVNNCSEILLAYHSANHDNNETNENEFHQFDDENQFRNKNKLILTDSKLGEPLICSILATLSKCFLYDLNGAFVNKDCTSLILKPIVNQISNILGNDQDFQVRLKLIMQCTQFLIQNNKDETLIKDFNYQILLKTRETNVKVQMSAIKVLHRLILTCSDDYLPFIPETIPFIAELSESEDEEVESLVKKLIIDIEQLVGEPINKYL